MIWENLKKKNYWGRIYYTISDVKIDLSRLEKIHICFEDGFESNVKIVNKKHTEIVNDHGCSETVTSDLYGFELNYHNVITWVDLTKVKVLKEDLPI